MTFPEYFSDDLQYLDELRQYILLKTEVAAGEKKEEELILAADKLFNYKPIVFDPYDPGNALKQGEEQLADMIATLEDNGTTDASSMTEWAFYHRCRYLKKKFAAMEGK
ncbi:MAG TPA: hypothetical protein PK339_12450 [Flavitalea sp.]|nr:hypothetical protein [Flavitalea sp.]